MNVSFKPECLKIVFWDRILLCIPDWARTVSDWATHCQKSSCPCLLGLKVCTTNIHPMFWFFFSCSNHECVYILCPKDQRFIFNVFLDFLPLWFQWARYSCFFLKKNQLFFFSVMSLISKAKICCSLLCWCGLPVRRERREEENPAVTIGIRFLSSRREIIATLGNSCHQHKCFHFKTNILIINTLPKKTFGGSRKHQIELN